MTPAPTIAEARSAILRPEEIAPAAWDDLFRRAASPHPFYSRHVIAAHRSAGLLPSDLRVLTVSSGKRLDALLPFGLRRDLSALGGLVARPFLSPYITATAPLIVADAGRATLAALADGLLAASGGRAWRWPLLSSESVAGSALLAALRSAGWSHAAAMSFERPVLDRRESFDAFLAGHPHRARFKDLRRRLRRLGETGRVAVESAEEGSRLAALVETFLLLEKESWKGAAGTALACRTETATFARTLFRDTGGPVSARADALTLDGRPIAISLALVGAGTATLLKTTYDETLRSQAPGLLLEAEIARLCHETGFADRLDSATLPGSPLESLYRDRETVAEIIAVPPGADALTLERRLRLARFERRGREAARRILPSARRKT
ncbi:GNAT family N-acetyltransferase [Enterovirga rhinocerotis]|uniref:Acetyltransferase (GNAT) family protein n=1 Tax=Enterovirga rhinocerotis TaxID=1339210 RepID=A0A4R7BUA2_9HYPH|nr:GNAT family N-acetyltransferase [Enterovirga rhinocerotis]TDR89081.1 acetyltransferase (GNAT) family protein [Enterovirga rhinocerotis]